MPELIGAEQPDYGLLCGHEEPWLLLTVSREKDWLHARWGSVCTRQALINGRKKAAAQMANTSNPPPEERVFKTERQVPPSPPPENADPTWNEQLSLRGDLVQRKRVPSNEADVIQTYTPQWDVLSTDSVCFRAPAAAREIGPDLCRGLMLPADCPRYSSVGVLDACTEMLGLLSMAVPWAAAVTEKVKDMQIQVGRVEQLQTRAFMAEEKLQRAEAELERVQGQVTALVTDRDNLRKDVDVLRLRLNKRNAQLKAARRASRKDKKLLELTEERCFQMGYDEAVRKAHALQWDHKLLLEEGMEDPVGREDPEEAPVVSSDPDEDLSD